MTQSSGDSEKTILKPCPFCGNSEEAPPGWEPWQGRAYLDVWQPYYDSSLNEDYAVTCFKCDAQGPTDPDKQRAIEKWNARA